MNVVEFSDALGVPYEIQKMESPFQVKFGADCGAIDWIKMRQDLGEDRWRSYVRLRGIVREVRRES